MRVMTVSDKWEYPWFAAWDLAFQCVPFALVDPDFAKKQLWVLLFEQFQHPNGQIPAYEWEFSDLNPPVHAWAVWRVYNMDRIRVGQGRPRLAGALLPQAPDQLRLVGEQGRPRGQQRLRGRLPRARQHHGRRPQRRRAPTARTLEQSDATGWMGMFCLNLMRIALELAKENPVYEALATKFFQHYVYVAGAMKHMGNRDYQLWDERGRLLLRRPPLPRRPVPQVPGPLARRPDPAVRRRAARGGLDRAVRRVPGELPLVPEAPEGPDRGGRPHRRARRQDGPTS